MKNTLICVDLDGTLFDTEAVNAASYVAALEEAGYRTLTPERYRTACFGLQYRDFLLGLMPGADAAAIERVHDRKKELYGQCLSAARPNRALLTLLDGMRPTAFLALVTTANRRNVQDILAAFDCTGFFDLVLTGEDVPRTKPDPACYLAAMEHFGITPAHTIIFEDSPAGLAAARSSGAAVFRAEPF